MRLFMALLFVSLSTAGFAKDLATFGGGSKITEKEYKEAIERLGPQAQMIKTNPQMKQRFLDHLINRGLLASKARSEKIDKTKRYKEVLQELELEALSNLYLENYIKDNTTDKKMKAYFNKNKK